MKRGVYRQVEFSMERMQGYGHYKIISVYRGKLIKVMTTDSMIWDYLDDSSDKELHMEAKKACYQKIRQKWEEAQ